MNKFTLSSFALIPILAVNTWSHAHVGHAHSDEADFFDFKDLRSEPIDAPNQSASRVVEIDPHYGGMWVVAGDVDNDGEIELISAKNKHWWTGKPENGRADIHYTSAVSVQKLDGTVLWKWGNPGEGRREFTHDVACQVYDWNNDGNLEVIITGKEELIIARGIDGEVIHQIDIPINATDCIITADLRGTGHHSDFVLKDRYFQMWAVSGEGNHLWSSRYFSAIDQPWNLGHKPIPVDIDGDGKDEIFGGFFMLNSDGSTRWEVEGTNQKEVDFVHSDSNHVIRYGETPEEWRLVFTYCNGEGICIIDGNGKIIHERTGKHYEAISLGNIFPGVEGPQILTDIDRGDRVVEVFDQELKLLGRIDVDYGRFHRTVDWDGDGFDDIVIADNGSIYNYEGKKICTLDLRGARGRLIDVADYTGDQVPDILIVGNDVKEATIFENKSGKSSEGVRWGTGPNFTNY